jgi:hypothetical protein
MDFSGIVLGIKVGTIRDIGKNTELEFGIKIDGYSYDDISFKNSSAAAKQEQTDVGLFLGFNYKF